MRGVVLACLGLLALARGECLLHRLSLSDGTWSLSFLDQPAPVRVSFDAPVFVRPGEAGPYELVSEWTGSPLTGLYLGLPVGLPVAGVGIGVFNSVSGERECTLRLYEAAAPVVGSRSVLRTGHLSPVYVSGRKVCAKRWTVVRGGLDRLRVGVQLRMSSVVGAKDWHTEYLSWDLYGSGESCVALPEWVYKCGGGLLELRYAPPPESGVALDGACGWLGSPPELLRLAPGVVTFGSASSPAERVDTVRAAQCNVLNATSGAFPVVHHIVDGGSLLYSVEASLGDSSLLPVLAPGSPPGDMFAHVPRPDDGVDLRVVVHLAQCSVPVGSAVTASVQQAGVVQSSGLVRSSGCVHSAVFSVPTQSWGVDVEVTTGVCVVGRVRARWSGHDGVCVGPGGAYTSSTPVGLAATSHASRAPHNTSSGSVMVWVDGDWEGVSWDSGVGLDMSGRAVEVRRGSGGALRVQRSALVVYTASPQESRLCAVRRNLGRLVSGLQPRFAVPDFDGLGVGEVAITRDDGVLLWSIPSMGLGLRAQCVGARCHATHVLSMCSHNSSSVLTCVASSRIPDETPVFTNGRELVQWLVGEGVRTADGWAPSSGLGLGVSARGVSAHSTTGMCVWPGPDFLLSRCFPASSWLTPEGAVTLGVARGLYNLVLGVSPRTGRTPPPGNQSPCPGLELRSWPPLMAACPGGDQSCYASSAAEPGTFVVFPPDTNLAAEDAALDVVRLVASVWLPGHVRGLGGCTSGQDGSVSVPLGVGARVRVVVRGSGRVGSMSVPRLHRRVTGGSVLELDVDSDFGATDDELVVFADGVSRPLILRAVRGGLLASPMSMGDDLGEHDEDVTWAHEAPEPSARRVEIVIGAGVGVVSGVVAAWLSRSVRV